MIPARQHLLVDLLTSPSTSAAIHDHTAIPLDEIVEILHDEEVIGTVESRTVKMLTVWSLTAEGRRLAATFPPAAKFY